MITWRLRRFSLEEVDHGTRTLAPIGSPNHGGGGGPRPHRRQLPAPHHPLDLLLGGPPRPARGVGLRPTALEHDHPAAAAAAQPGDPLAAAAPRRHGDADAGPGGATAAGPDPAADRGD